MGWKGFRAASIFSELPVAIRFRWIWVGSWCSLFGWGVSLLSQSAFAGYGLEEPLPNTKEKPAPRRNPLSLDMGWKKEEAKNKAYSFKSRNPLSLDMGWKKPGKRL